MNLFIDEHRQWIKNLLEANVDFIIIGGYSVIFHGYKRTTGDIDIWLRPANDNRDRLIPVLRSAGFDEAGINQIGSFDFREHLVFTVGDVPERIDFLTRISLVEYAEADEQKIIADIDGLPIPFLHLNHLILSKMNTGRSKDIADIEMLQQVEREKRNR